jgi:endo-1,4-beta-xylanase
MTFPTFPATLTWNTPYRDRERVSLARYQAGVEQVERVGINRRSQSIDVNIRIQNADEISTFLRECRGKPFRLRTDSQLLGENLLYSCDEWEMPELGKNLWEFRATFNQERRFEPKIAQYLSLTADAVNLTEGQTIGLTAGLSGFATMPTLSWTIISGTGTITPGVDNLATYESPLSAGGTAIVRVRVLGTDLEATVSLVVAQNPGVVSVTVSPATVDRNANDITPTVLTASVNRTGGAANAVLWSIRSGTAALDASTALTTNVLIPNLDQTIVIRATSIADASKWAESIITVLKPALISGINASASPSSLLPGEASQLSATVVGVGVFDPAVTWSIVSGGGTLNGSQYTAGQNAGTVVLEAVSVANPLIKQQTSIVIIPVASITSVTASSVPSQIAIGSTAQLSAVVTGTGNYDQTVTWSIDSGPGTVSGNILTATGVGTIVARATSTQDTSKSGTVSITSTASVQNGVTGITGTATPSTIYIGQTSIVNVVVTGSGAFSTDTSWFAPGLDITGTGNTRTFTAANFPNTSTIRVSSVQNPSIWVDIAIVVVLPPNNINFNLNDPMHSITIGIL